MQKWTFAICDDGNDQDGHYYFTHQANRLYDTRKAAQKAVVEWLLANGKSNVRHLSAQDIKDIYENPEIDYDDAFVDLADWNDDEPNSTTGCDHTRESVFGFVVFAVEV